MFVGIRFACHNCQHALHVKDFQAGRRGKCPECKTVFQIPSADAPLSIPVESATAAVAKSPAVDPSVAGESQHAVAESPASEGAPASPEASPASPQSAARAEQQPEQSSSAAWYLRISDGQQFGPVDEPTLMQWLSEGRVTQESYVWRDGWPDWTPAPQAFPAQFASAPPVAPAPGDVPPATPPPAPPQKSVTPAAANNVATASPAAVTDSRTHTAPADGVSGLTPIQRARLDKRLKKKRNYQLMLVGLCIAAVLLVCALVVVVMMQGE
ncbi:MAG: hypothetical protein Aurels2KO_01310 [Aureliella sp.]